MADLTRRRTVATVLGVVLLLAATAGVWWVVFARTTPGSADGDGATGLGSTVDATRGNEGTSPGSPGTSPHASPGPADLGGALAVFLGDGNVAGHGAGERRFTTRLSQRQDWTEDNLGHAGTGYSVAAASGSCGEPACPALPEMVARTAAIKPDVVLVSAGSADLRLVASRPTEVRRAVDRTYRDLAQALPGARIFALSPIWTGDAAAPPEVATLSGWIRSAARTYGADFIPGGASWLANTPDATTGGELTAAGHARVAAVLGHWLELNG